jgi:hypothetical protein
VKRNRLPHGLKPELENLSLAECKIIRQWLTARIRLLKQPNRKPVEQLNLSNRAINTLINNKLLTVWDIELFGLENLTYLRGAGKKVAAEITAAMMKTKERAK